ncbi:MAG: hypothetical protein R2845_15840 [Thermomicrobiales bacterium]
MEQVQSSGPPVSGVGQRAAANGWVLETNSLTKQFGPLTAVDDLNIKLQQGEVLGFLDPMVQARAPRSA